MNTIIDLSNTMNMNINTITVLIFVATLIITLIILGGPNER